MICQSQDSSVGRETLGCKTLRQHHRQDSTVAKIIFLFLTKIHLISFLIRMSVVVVVVV